MYNHLWQGFKSGFYINSIRVCDISQRLKSHKNKQNWLSMNPKNSKYIMWGKTQQFGECNENNRLQGKGIQIYPLGTIVIGNFADGINTAGHYIVIKIGDEFSVGEYKREAHG